MSRKGPAAVDPVAWTPDSGERLRGGSPRWVAHRSTRRSSGVKPSNWSALRSGRSWRSPGRVEPPIRRCTPGSQADREARAQAEDPDGADRIPARRAATAPQGTDRATQRRDVDTWTLLTSPGSRPGAAEGS